MEKYFVLTAVSLLLACPVFSQSAGQEKKLVVYFSKSGNTETLANHVHSLVGGDKIKLEPAEPYPASYSDTVARYRLERDREVRVPLRTGIANMDTYDVVFLGYPIWGGTIPMVLVTFLESYDFTGKTIVPFCTSGGSGISRSVTDIRRLVPGAAVLEGFHTSSGNASGTRNDAAAWLRRINILD
ncbi:flavodoxin [Brucepastera parasyntrophica]|uniref:flavodoxin n=1 Tax=Brucepastera parasyntrophica TaxID=2880008 RepID=UPI002109DCE4|nr:flavodoxin [Brucepastera parasyntrophica]ULQ59268.1 flavodoxin [Brucepastera parasyntrophica]